MQRQLKIKTKTFQKVLDKIEKLWYNIKAVWERRRTASWKLNNAKVTTLKIPWIEEWEEKSEKTKKSVIASNRNEQDFSLCKRKMIYNLIKSLILAQDERWRHA